MPPGKKGQASSLGQNKVHFHKYNLILLPPDTISSIQVKKGVYCGNTDFHKPALPIHLM